MAVVRRPQEVMNGLILLIFYVILYSHLKHKNMFLARSKACRKNMSKQGKMFLSHTKLTNQGARFIR